MSNFAGESAALLPLLPDDRGVSTAACLLTLGDYSLQPPALRVCAFHPCGVIFSLEPVEHDGMLRVAAMERIPPAQPNQAVVGLVHSSGGGVGFMRW